MATPEEYNEYIMGGVWRERSQMFIKQVGKCELCGDTTDLECHHITYRNLGEETKEDIQVLCSKCHDKKTQANEYKKTKMKRFVGGQDIGMEDLKMQEQMLTEQEELDPEGFWDAHKNRRRRGYWVQENE